MEEDWQETKLDATLVDDPRNPPRTRTSEFYKRFRENSHVKSLLRKINKKFEFSK